MANKDNSWGAPDTTAFKNITPDDLPKSTYSYKGDAVGNKGNLPNMGEKYKGEKVGKKSDLPKSNYKYKGEKVGKKSKK